MSKRILAGLLSTLFLAAAGCTHASGARVASADLTPNVGGDDVDPSSARNNTDPAVADQPVVAASRSVPTGTGSGQ